MPATSTTTPAPDICDEMPFDDTPLKGQITTKYFADLLDRENRFIWPIHLTFNKNLNTCKYEANATVKLDFVDDPINTTVRKLQPVNDVNVSIHATISYVTNRWKLEWTSTYNGTTYEHPALQSVVMNNSDLPIGKFHPLSGVTDNEIACVSEVVEDEEIDDVVDIIAWWDHRVLNETDLSIKLYRDSSHPQKLFYRSHVVNYWGRLLFGNEQGANRVVPSGSSFIVVEMYVNECADKRFFKYYKGDVFEPSNPENEDIIVEFFGGPVNNESTEYEYGGSLLKLVLQSDDEGENDDDRFDMSQAADMWNFWGLGFTFANQGLAYERMDKWVASADPSIKHYAPSSFFPVVPDELAAELEHERVPLTSDEKEMLNISIKFRPNVMNQFQIQNYGQLLSLDPIGAPNIRCLALGHNLNAKPVIIAKKPYEVFGTILDSLTRDENITGDAERIKRGLARVNNIINNWETSFLNKRTFLTLESLQGMGMGPDFFELISVMFKENIIFNQSYILLQPEQGGNTSVHILMFLYVDCSNAARDKLLKFVSDPDANTFEPIDKSGTVYIDKFFDMNKFQFNGINGDLVNFLIGGSSSNSLGGEI